MHLTRSWSGKSRPVLSQAPQPDLSLGNTIPSMWHLKRAVHDPFEGWCRVQRGEQSALFLCHPAFPPRHCFLGKLGTSSVPPSGDASAQTCGPSSSWGQGYNCCWLCTIWAEDWMCQVYDSTERKNGSMPDGCHAIRGVRQHQRIQNRI